MDKSPPTFYFQPFSLRSWILLFREGGMIAFAMLLVLTSGKIFDIRNSSEFVSGALSGGMIYRAILLLCAALVLLFYIRLLKIPKSIAFNMGLLYVFVSLLSISWSYVPIASLGKSVEVVLGALLVLVTINSRASLFRLVAAFNLVTYFIFFQLIIVLFGFIIGIDGYSERGAGGIASLVGRRAAGPFISANGVGYLSVTLSVIILNYMVWCKKFNVFTSLYLFFTILMMLLSTSRTSLALFLVCVLILFFYKYRKVFTLLIVPTVLISIGYAGVSILRFIQGDTAESNFLSLSGRTILWEHSINMILNNLSVGLGFGVGSRTMFFLNRIEGFDDSISTAHNGFIEVLSGVGLLGFIPWFIALVFMIVFCMRSYSVNTQVLPWMVCVWPILVGVSIMSVGVGGGFNEFFLMFYMILGASHCYNFPRRSKEVI